MWTSKEHCQASGVALQRSRRQVHNLRLQLRQPASLLGPKGRACARHNTNLVMSHACGGAPISSHTQLGRWVGAPPPVHPRQSTSGASHHYHCGDEAAPPLHACASCAAFALCRACLTRGAARRHSWQAGNQSSSVIITQVLPRRPQTASLRLPPTLPCVAMRLWPRPTARSYRSAAACSRLGTSVATRRDRSAGIGEILRAPLPLRPGNLLLHASRAKPTNTTLMHAVPRQKMVAPAG